MDSFKLLFPDFPNEVLLYFLQRFKNIDNLLIFFENKRKQNMIRPQIPLMPHDFLINHFPPPILPQNNFNLPNQKINHDEKEILKNIKKKNLKFENIDLNILDLSNEFKNLLKKLFKVKQDFNYAKVSYYLMLIINNKEFPDDILNRIILAGKEKTSSLSMTYISESIDFLTNIFPYLTKKTIDKEFKNNFFQFILFYNFFKKNKIIELKKYRIIQLKVDINDPLLSFEIELLLENLNKLELDKKKIDEENQIIENARLDGSLIECGCCFNEIPIDRCLQCPDGHLFCSNCVQTSINVAIVEGKSNIKCLSMNGCNQEIPITELKRLIPEITIQKLIQTEVMNEIYQSGLENIHKCFHCGALFEFSGSEIMKCNICNKETCIKCKKESHRGITCEEFKIKNNNSIEEKMNEAIIRECPKCNTRFTKDEGCNKMICPKCKTIICYICRKVIPSNVGYSHFWRENGVCPPNKCPLWVDNKALHDIEAELAKNEF